MTRSAAEYRVWARIIQRCTDSNDHRFHHYGGRGITVCDRWRHSFPAFYADMGPRPTPTHTIERINNNGHYEPANCVWLPRSAQSRNKRDNRPLTFRGRTQLLTDWANELGINKTTLFLRLKRGWSVERTLTAPLAENWRTIRARQHSSL
jgi:hypothetical protein